MTNDTDTPPTDAELVEKLQALVKATGEARQALATYSAAFAEFYAASFRRLSSIVKDALEAFDDMAGQTFGDDEDETTDDENDGGDRPPLDGAIHFEGVSFEQAERNAAAWSEEWNGSMSGDWARRRLHDAGPPTGLPSPA